MRLLSRLFSLLLLAAIAAGGAFFYGQQKFTEAGPLLEEKAVVFPRGATLNGIADRLGEAGVVSNPQIFRLGVQLKGDAGRLRAGEYAFPPGASMAEVLEIMVTGRAVQHKVTIPEGRTVTEILAILESDNRLTGGFEGIPDEGALAPETYFFTRGEARQAILDRMKAAQEKTLSEAWASRAPDLPLNSPEEALILASIVEKETGLAAERPLVASVFVNRLNKGMRLQSDPTVIYGVTLGRYVLDRGLLRSELDTTTPYNTYRINGLPPTPIANPGKASIEAVLNPAESDYFYFVADGEGGHAFAKTLDAHNANVRRWREIEKQRASE